MTHQYRILITGTLALGLLACVNAQPNTWVRSGNLNGPARHDALGFAIGDKVYTCLGLDMEGDTLTDLWEYDPALETWTEKAAFPGVARVGAVAFAIGNNAFVATGATTSDTLNDLWAYDPTADAWMQKADLPGSARTRAGACTVGLVGYVFAGTGSPVQDMDGYDMYPYLGDLWAYNPVLDGWSQRADLYTTIIAYDPPWTRWCSFTLDGKAFVTNGNGVDAYDPLTDSWTPKADIDPDLFYDPNQDFIGYSLGAHGYLTNMGRGGSGPWSQTHPNKLLRYDPVTDTWILSGYFPGFARDEVAYATIGPVVYVMGGDHYYRTWYNPDPYGWPPVGEDYRIDLGEVWSYDIRDCLGIPDGLLVPGSACDDGNGGTYGDAYDPQCTCTGTSQPVQPFHPDEVDATFNTGTGFDGDVQALLLQPDGKILAAGAFSMFNGTACNGIARLNADGSLDGTFNGAVGGRALALQPDGRILVGGNGIARLMADGSLDASYDTYLSGIGTQPVNALAVRSDGRILAGGSWQIEDEWGNVLHPGLMQLMPDGALDVSFVPDLIVGDPTQCTVHALLLRADGTVLVGMANAVPGMWGEPWGFNLANLEEDGSAPMPFAGNIGTSFLEPVRALAVRPNGEIVVGGEFLLFDNDFLVNDGIPRKHVTLFDEDGALDLNFDPGPSSDGPVRALASGPQGQIIAGGDFTNYRNAQHNGIVQLNDFGFADPSFQSGTGFNGGVHAFALQPDGQLIVGGAFTSYNGIACGHITRLRTPGPICIPSQLTTTADPVITCGAVNLTFNGTSIIAATEVPGANKYQFLFTNVTGQPAYSRSIAKPSRSFVLTKWLTLPLKAGRTYNVTVRASFDGGATYCAYGPSCTVKMSWFPLTPGQQPRSLDPEWPDGPEVLLYPNPTNGDDLRIGLSGLDPELTTVSLDITDLFGKRVMSSTLPINDGELESILSLNADLTNGLYVVTITAGEQVFNERVVINR